MKFFNNQLLHWAKVLSKFISVQVIIQGIGFLSGLLLVRTLEKEEYAYFTIANTMQGTINILADSGISVALCAIGGKVWQDAYRFGQLINAALELRRYLAVGVISIVTPLLLWLLLSNGASWYYAVVITAVMLVGVSFQLTTGVLEVIPRLHSQINRIQTLDLTVALSRLSLLCVAYLSFLNAAVAIFIASFAMGIQKLLLEHWVKDSIDTQAPVKAEDKSAITKFIRAQAPSAIFYTVQGQITVWLISIFGNVANVAEVGALGRLAAIFNILAAVMSSVVLPSFARCQSYRGLQQKFWQILVGLLVFEGVLVGAVAMFPNQILWILGKQYANLQQEVLLLTLSTAFAYFVGTLWSLNSAKGWIEHSWLYIPATLLMQVILLQVLDISSVRGVILFGIGSTFPSLLLNIFLLYNGFSSYKLIQERA